MGRIKLLVKKEINDSLIYSVETVFSGILSIAFYIFIANFLTLADVGAYSLALVYSSIIAGIANLGLSAGYERTYFEFNPMKGGKIPCLAAVMISTTQNKTATMGGRSRFYWHQ